MEPEVKELLKQCKDLAAAKNYEQLLINAKEIVRLDRKNYNGYIFYGLGAAHQGQRDVSEKAYRKAIELNPAQPTAHQVWPAFISFLCTQGLVELFTMSGDNAKLADAITELLALLKPDHAKYVEYLLKRANALQQQPAKVQVAAAAWKTLLEHPWSEEHRLLATRHLYEFELATEKTELHAETEKNFQARAKKVPPAEHEQLRQTIERELRTAMLARTEIDRYLQRLMELSSTSEFHVKAIQRLQARLAVATTPAARAEIRASIRHLCASAITRQPSFFAVETLLGFLEEEHFANEAAPVPAPAPSAARFYRLLMHAHPDRPMSGLGFAHLFLQQGKSEDALTLLELSLRKVPQSIQGLLALGYTQLDAALYQAATETVTKLRAELAKRPASDPPLAAAQTATDLIWARVAHRGFGNKEEARQTYTAVLTRQPQHVEALRGLAQLASEASDLSAALEYYAKLIALRPADAEAVAESGHVLLRSNKLPEAIERFQQAITLKPSAAMAHHWLGLAYWRSGGALRTEKSKTEFLLSAQQRPGFAGNFTYLGHFYREVDKDEARARRCYQKAVTLDPHEEAGVALADMYLAAGQEALAVALYKDLTGRSNRVLWAWLRLAVVQERDGDHEEASASFQAALRLDASNTVCWRGLAEAYRKQGKYMAALKAFSRLLELDPKSAYGRYQVAAIELLLGLRTKSLAAFQGLLDELPHYVPALKGAGEAMLAIAREQYAHGFAARATESAGAASAMLAKCTAEQANLRSVWKAYGDAELLRAHLTHLQSGSSNKELEILNSAIKAYKTALDLDPKSAPQLQDLAVARYQRAVALCTHTLLQADAGKVALLKEDAAKELAQAEEGIKEALRGAPASAHLWRALGVVATSPSLKQHAFIASIEANNKSGGAWADLGHFYLQQRADDLASRAYAEAQLLEPHASGGWLGHALVEEIAANKRITAAGTSAVPAVELKKAKVAYDQAMQTLATPVACLGAAHTLFVCGDYESASAAVRRFMQLEGATPQALNLLGLILEAQGLYSSAVAVFNEGLKLLELYPKAKDIALPAFETTLTSPNMAAAASALILSANLGRVLYFARRATESIAALSRADLTSRTNLLFLAAAQALTGANGDAIKTAERALAAQGSVADAKSLHALVVRLYVAQDDQKKALAVGKTAAAETKDASLWQLFYAVASQAGDAEATRLAAASLPNSAEGGVLRSVQAQIEHSPVRARSALLSALHCHPTDEPLWRRLASLTLDHVPASTSALASLSAALVPRPTVPEDFRLQAALLLAQGKSTRLGSAALLRSACSAAQRCLRISPHDIDALYLLAAAAYSLARRSKQLQQWQRAENAIKLALGALPSDALARTRPALLAAQADCLLFLGKHKEAEEIAAQLSGGAKSGPMWAASQSQLARCKAAQTDIIGALALYKTALKDTPTSDRWTELAALYDHSGQRAAAELCHRQAIAARPANSPRRLSSLLRLAHHFILRRKWDDALAALSQAAAINELHPTLLLLQGLVLARQNAAADSEWCLQAAVAIEPSLPLASLLLSELHLAGGNVAVAESDAFYERDNVPDADGALFQLAKVAVASKQTESALNYLLRAAHMNPARGDYWAELQKLKQKSAAQPSAKK